MGLAKLKKRATAKPLRVSSGTKQPHSLVRFFGESPLIKAKINLERKPDYGRRVKL